MTLLEDILSTWPAHSREGFLKWLKDTPPEVQEIVNRFPPMFRIWIDDETYYVVGYEETGHEDHVHVLASPIDPLVPGNYDRAVSAARSLCPDRISVFTQAELN